MTLFVHGVRSAVFVIVFFGLTIPAVLLALPVAAAGRPATRAYGRAWVSFHRWCVRWLLGIRVRIEGEVPSAPVLVAAKHQAMFEAVDLLHVLDAPAAVMKRQLAGIPLWGWIARRYGAIPVDRAGGAAALRAMMRSADEAVAERRSILIFPEGTRVAPGSAPPLQPGFAGLYRRLGLPVVPAALDSGRLWPRRGFLRRSGTITYRFGEPVPTGLARDEVTRRVHAAINALEPSRP